jgi:hypothetical protein
MSRREIMRAGLWYPFASFFQEFFKCQENIKTKQRVWTRRCSDYSIVSWKVWSFSSFMKFWKADCHLFSFNPDGEFITFYVPKNFMPFIKVYQLPCFINGVIWQPNNAKEKYIAYKNLRTEWSRRMVTLNQLQGRKINVSVLSTAIQKRNCQAAPVLNLMRTQWQTIYNSDTTTSYPPLPGMVLRPYCL